MGDLDRVGEVFGHHHVLVVGRAVAEMVAELGRSPAPRCRASPACRDVRLVALRPVREIALPGEHLLAHVPLDREVAVRDRGADLREVGLEGALVGGEEIGPRGGRDEPVADRHRRRQADLEAHARRQRPAFAQRAEPLIGRDRLGRVAGVERDRRRVDPRPEAEQLPLADQLAVPLVDARLVLVRRHLHRRVVSPPWRAARRSSAPARRSRRPGCASDARRGARRSR